MVAVVLGIEVQAAIRQLVQSKRTERGDYVAPLRNRGFGTAQSGGDSTRLTTIENEHVTFEHNPRYTMVDRWVNDGVRAADLQSGMDGKTLGERIKSRRSTRALTQVQLGRAIGVSKAVISSWELDNVKNLQLRNLFALADALDTDPRMLALGSLDRLAVPVYGFQGTDTGVARLRSRRQKVK